jgi:transcriptional regulator with XRE-family HTH domain
VKGCEGTVKAATFLPSLVFLGRELRRAREAAGMSQAQLAEKINYAPSFISMVETADRLPKKDFAQACDKALDTRGLLTRILTELVTRDGEYGGLSGPFAIAELGEASEFVFLDDSLKGRVVQGSEQVADILQNWELIRAEALSQKQSIALVKEGIKSWP